MHVFYRYIYCSLLDFLTILLIKLLWLFLLGNDQSEKFWRKWDFRDKQQNSLKKKSFKCKCSTQLSYCWQSAEFMEFGLFHFFRYSTTCTMNVWVSLNHSNKTCTCTTCKQRILHKAYSCMWLLKED